MVGGSLILDSQLLILLVQASLGVATIIGSFIVAKRYGEKSANEYALRQERRRILTLTSSLEKH